MTVIQISPTTMGFKPLRVFIAEDGDNFPMAVHHCSDRLQERQHLLEYLGKSLDFESLSSSDPQCLPAIPYDKSW